MKIRESKRFFILFYMLGFFAGIIYVNVMAGEYIIDTGIWGEFFREQYLQTDIEVGEFLWYVTYIRVWPVICLAVLGGTKLRKAGVWGFVLWTGFSSGLVLTSAVMKLGVKGIILCLISMTPHFLCYIAGYLMLLWFLVEYPGSRWNLTKTVCFVLLIAMGILLECYVNPVIMKMFLKTL